MLILNQVQDQGDVCSPFVSCYGPGHRLVNRFLLWYYVRKLIDEPAGSGW